MRRNQKLNYPAWGVTPVVVGCGGGLTLGLVAENRVAEDVLEQDAVQRRTVTMSRKSDSTVVLIFRGSRVGALMNTSRASALPDDTRVPASNVEGLPACLVGSFEFKLSLLVFG